MRLAERLGGGLISDIPQLPQERLCRPCAMTFTANPRLIPAQAGIQYAAAAVVDCDAGVYWIIRWSLSSGAHSRDPLADDDRLRMMRERVHVRSCRSVSRIR